MNSLPKEQLAKALLSLKNEKEMESFLVDLLTPAEMEEFVARLTIAKQLSEGQTQRNIAQNLKSGVATVTRVNQWLNRGAGGYKLVLERLYNHRHQRH